MSNARSCAATSVCEKCVLKRSAGLLSVVGMYEVCKYKGGVTCVCGQKSICAMKPSR